MLSVAVVAQDRSDVADHCAERGGDQEHQDERSVELAEEELHTDLLRVLDDDDRKQDDGDSQRPMAPARALGRSGLPLSRRVCHWNGRYPDAAGLAPAVTKPKITGFESARILFLLRWLLPY